MTNMPKKRKRQEKKPDIGIIVQARMTSKRFPGKSMALLNGKPVLRHVLERAKLISPKAKVIVAVPDTDDSDPMLELAASLRVDNFCGSELDVLDRYYRAALFFGFNTIIRITGDCPCISPIISKEVLDLFIWRKLDYASNVHPVRTYPRGLDTEVFSLDCLECAHQASRDMKLAVGTRWREHVTPWMQETDGIRRGCVKQKKDSSHINWCVDYPEDIARLEEVLKLAKEQKDEGRA